MLTTRAWPTSLAKANACVSILASRDCSKPFDQGQGHAITTPHYAYEGRTGNDPDTVVFAFRGWEHHTVVLKVAGPSDQGCVASPEGRLQKVSLISSRERLGYISNTHLSCKQAVDLALNP